MRYRDCFETEVGLINSSLSRIEKMISPVQAKEDITFSPLKGVYRQSRGSLVPSDITTIYDSSIVFVSPTLGSKVSVSVALDYLESRVKKLGANALLDIHVYKNHVLATPGLLLRTEVNGQTKDEFVDRFISAFQGQIDERQLLNDQIDQQPARGFERYTEAMFVASGFADLHS